MNKLTTTRREVNKVNNNYNFPVALQPIFLKDQREIKSRKAVVRTDTMDTLGIVSNDYTLVNHADVIDSFREAGRKYKVQEKISLTKNGAHMFYQMTFPKVEAEVRKGDIVRMMMIAKNSYNAMNSLQVIFGAFRLVCENGMIIGTRFMSFNYRHVGNVGGINDEAMIGQYKNAYAQYIKLFGERMPLITAMSQKPLMLTDNLFKNDFVKLPEYLLSEAKQSFETENDNTAWGYYNSLTYAVTHKMRKENADMTLKYGTAAWKAAEKVMN